MLFSANECGKEAEPSLGLVWLMGTFRVARRLKSYAPRHSPPSSHGKPRQLTHNSGLTYNFGLAGPDRQQPAAAAADAVVPRPARASVRGGPRDHYEPP